MSTTLRVPTTQQRAVEATSRLKEVLGLDDLKLLSTALAEAAADEAKINPRFARKVRDVYKELVSLKPSRRAAEPKSEIPATSLRPLPGTEGLRIDPFAPLDPYLLTRIYGKHQLRAALSGYSLPKLKQAPAVVEECEPGAKPKNKSQKQAVIDFVVDRVAGPGY